MLWNTYSQSFLLMTLNFLTTGQIQNVPYTYTKICFDCNFPFFKNDEKKNFLICHWTELQWQIQGRGLGGPPPLFLDQTVARWEKFFFEDGPSSLISGSGWPPPLPLSDGLDPPLCYTITNHKLVVIISPFTEANVKTLPEL